MMQKAWYIAMVIISSLFSITASGQITGIKIAGDTCTSLTLSLQAEGTSSSPYFFWNFGDPASGTNDTITITGLSASPYPTHTFSGPGIYTVCVSLQEPGFPVSTICRTISVGLCCNGIISSSDTCVENSIPFTVVSSASITGISWNFGDPASGAANTSVSLSPSHLFSAAGSYTVTAVVAATCGSFTVNYPISVVACQTVSPCSATIRARDTCLQNGTRFELATAATVSSINWNFGDPASGASNIATGTAPTHLFSASGTYTITAVIAADCGDIVATTTVNIINCIINNPCTASISITDTCLELGTSFSLTSLYSVIAVNWNFGDVASSGNNTSTAPNPTHIFSNSGAFLVRATANLSCGTISATRTVIIRKCDSVSVRCTIAVPNAFTPNGDGLNDGLKPIIPCALAEYEFWIYNRWGEVVYNTTNVADRWDGTQRGYRCNTGVFFYQIRYKFDDAPAKVLGGNFTLIR